MKQDRVLVAVIVAPHGVKGAVRIKSFTANPQDVARYGPLEDESGERRFELAQLGPLSGKGKDALLARLSGIEDRDAAEALRGLKLFLPRRALPQPGEEEYYHVDLIGLAAVLRDGSLIGRVAAIHDFGAGDILEIAREGLSPLLLPFTREIVPLVDLEAGRLVLDPPPGLTENVERSGA